MGVRKALKWSNLAVFRGLDPTEGGFWGGLRAGLENRGDERSVYVWFCCAVSGAAEAIQDPRRQLLEACRMPVLGTQRLF